MLSTISEIKKCESGSGNAYEWIDVSNVPLINTVNLCPFCDTKTISCVCKCGAVYFLNAWTRSINNKV